MSRSYEELKDRNAELEANLEIAQMNLKTVAMETRAQCALEFAKAAVGRPNPKLYVCIEGGCMTAVVGPSEMDFDVEILDMDNAKADEDEELRVGELENEMNDLMESGEYRDYTEYVPIPGEEEEE